MPNPRPSSGCPFAALSEQLERLARKPLQPRRHELRRLAVRFRTAALAEAPADHQPQEKVREQ